jgi:hypothetical protein
LQGSSGLCCTSSVARGTRKTSFTGLLKLEDKIGQMTSLVKGPTEVRLDESMLENFNEQVRSVQISNPV